jgi:hypothetical protein
MLLVKTENGNVVRWPYSLEMFRKDHSNSSLPSDPTPEFLATYGVFPVQERPFPHHVDKCLYRIEARVPALGEDGIWWKDYDVHAWPEDQAIGHIKSMRFYKLKQTDFLAMVDYPHTEESRQAWLAYRQALRDMPTQPNFPWGYSWPTPPWEIPGL